MLTGFCKEFNLFPGLPVEAVRNSAVRLCYHLVATLKCSFLSKLWSFIRVLICLFFLFISIFYKWMQNNFLSSPCCLHQHQTHIHVCSFHVTYLHERAHISDACRVVRCVNVSVHPDVIFFNHPHACGEKRSSESEKTCCAGAGDCSSSFFRYTSPGGSAVLQVWQGEEAPQG